MAVNSSPLIKLLNEQLSSQEIIILFIQNRTQVAPVAFSLMASFMSAITLLGVTQENYTYGTQVSSGHELCLIDSVFVHASHVMIAVRCDQPCLPVGNSCGNSHILARLL